MAAPRECFREDADVSSGGAAPAKPSSRSGTAATRPARSPACAVPMIFSATAGPGQAGTHPRHRGPAGVQAAPFTGGEPPQCLERLTAMIRRAKNSAFAPTPTASSPRPTTRPSTRPIAVCPAWRRAGPRPCCSTSAVCLHRSTWITDSAAAARPGPRS